MKEKLFDLFSDLSDCKKIDLGTAFEISSGIMDNSTQYFIKEDGVQKPVSILRMGSFDLHKGALKNMEGIVEAEAKINVLRKKSKKKKVVKEINIDKLLDKNDYVINIREIENKFVGVSLLNSAINPDLFKTDKKFVISHHFIVLRPRKFVPFDIDVEFLHIVMNAILYWNLIKDKKGRITIKLLNKCVIALPTADKQKEIVNKYKKMEKELADCQQEIQKMNETIASNIFNSDIKLKVKI